MKLKRSKYFQVLQQWMSVIRSPSNGSVNGSPKPGAKKRPLSTKYPEGQFVSAADESGSGSDNEAQLDFDNSKDYNPNEDSDGSDGAKRKKLKREDSADVDELLGSSETSDDDDDDDEDVLSKFYKKRDAQKQKDEERRKAKEKKKTEEKKAKSYSKTEMRDKVDTPQKERIKDIARKLKEESKSPTNISSLGRIPKIAKTEERKISSNGPSFGDMMGGLDSVKTKPKAPPIKNKNKDLLETFTNQSPIKPKSKSESKSSDKHRSSSDKERSRDDKEKSRDKNRDRDRHSSHKSSDRDKERSRDKDKEHRRERKDSTSKSSSENSSKSSSRSESDKSDRPKPKLSIPEKRSHDSSQHSPKDDAKKSPKVIKDSNFLGDILGDIMKEPPKKKKRRPSDVKISDSNLKELAEKAEKAKVEEKKERDTSPELAEKEEALDDKKEESVEKADELEFSEPTSELPREVRGILVYVKGNKSKKKITWKEERDLVSVQYFELDETERCNVWKEKTFEEMKKKEAMFEKAKFGTGLHHQDESEESKQWKLTAITFEGENLELADKLRSQYGSASEEKKVQEARELRVLKALHFNKTPTDPSEPDAGSNDKTGGQVRPIPLEDLSDNKDDSTYSYTWPAPAGYSVPPPSTTSSIPTNINDLLSNISSGLFNKLPPVTSYPPTTTSAPPPDLSKPPPGMMTSEEAALLEAQKAAAAAFGLNNTTPPASNYPPPSNNGYHGYSSRGRGGFYNNDRRYNRDRDDNYSRDRDDRGPPPRRPCKFWMDRGHCKLEDRCTYLHPQR